jgi:hypothetical protein
MNATQEQMNRAENVGTATPSPQSPPDGGKDREMLAPLFAPDAADGFRTRWDAVQIGFVDDPRRAVTEADRLVTEVVKDLTATFSDEHARLEAQLNENADAGSAASTEGLRVALRRYRSLFQRLLAL